MKITKLISLVLTASLLTLFTPPANAVVSGQACTKAQLSKTTKTKGVSYKCVLSNSQYVWKKASTIAKKPSKVIAASQVNALKNLESGPCTANAPTGWALIPNSDASAADLVSPDQNQEASWGMLVVPAVVGGMGTLPPYNHPDAYSSDPAVVVRHHLAFIESSQNPKADLNYTSAKPEIFGNYTSRTLKSSMHTIQVLYTSFPGDGFAISSIIVLRLAKTTNALWKSKGGKLAHYALSIQCVTQYNPEGYTTPTIQTRKSSGTIQSDTEAGYNPWLGNEYVHDPVTGTNLLVTPDQWSNTGPNGPGYYGPKPNGYVQYSPGRYPNS